MPEHGNKQPPHGVMYRCSFENVQSKTMLHVGDNYKVVGWQEDGARNFTNPRQIWDVCDMGSGEMKVMLWNEQAGMYLRANSHRAPVCLSHEDDRAECFWKLEWLGRDTTYRIRNLETNELLDMAAGYSFNGVLVHAWEGHGGQNQEWVMHK